MINAMQAAAAQYGSERAPVDGINTVVILGASIEYAIGQSVASYPAAILDLLQIKHGLTGITQVLCYGYTGAGVVTITARWNDTVKPAIQALPDGGAGTMVITMPTGNDVAGLVPFATASPTTIAARKADLEALITDIKATVKTAVLIDNTFRLYNYPATTCVNDEEQGVKPFNNALNSAVSLALTPWNYQGTALSPYNFARNWYSKVLMDSTHYVELGYGILAIIWVDIIASVIKGTLPPFIPRKVDPVNDQKNKVGRVLISYRNTANVTRSSNLLVATARGSTTSAAPFLVPCNGYDPVLGLVARPALTGVTTVTGLGTGKTAHDITNDKLRDAFVYTNSKTFVLLEGITGYAPGQKVKVKIACARAVAAGVTRVQQFSQDGVNSIGSIDSAIQTGQEPKYFEYEFTADANGTLWIYFRCDATNNTGAYASAIEADPVPMDIALVA